MRLHQSCVPETHSDSKIKDGSEWMQGHKAESGDQGRAVTGVQVGVTELEPGLEQWDGEEGG